MSAPRVYLAGPEVFRRDAADAADALKALCAQHGLQGVFPLDGALTLRDGESPADLAARIRAANLALIESADMVLANVSPFRGSSADDGTAFEMGYALALGRPVFAYTTASDDLLTRTRAQCAVSPDAQGVWRDAQGMAVEDFGLPANLMLVDPARGGVHPSAEAAVLAAAAHWIRSGERIQSGEPVGGVSRA